MLPLEFADLVDTGRVLAEAAPFVVVRFVVGSDVFLAVRDVLFGGSSLPSCVPSCTGLRLVTLVIVLPPMLMCLNVSGEGTPFTGVMFWTAGNRRTCLDGVRTWKKLSKAFLTVWEDMHHK